MTPACIYYTTLSCSLSALGSDSKRSRESRRHPNFDSFASLACRIIGIDSSSRQRYDHVPVYAVPQVCSVTRGQFAAEEDLLRCFIRNDGSLYAHATSRINRDGCWPSMVGEFEASSL
jgi:hypothetical protein